MSNSGDQHARPQLSPDGNWWWDGTKWVPAHTQPPTAPVALGRAAPRRRVSRWLVQIGIFVVIALVGLGIAKYNGDQEAAKSPQVGDCAERTGSDSIKRVDCSDPAATYRVTSRQTGTTDGETACGSDPEATSFYSFDSTSHGMSVSSFVLCLADN